MLPKEWPEQAVEKLKFLIKDGFSARQIADRLGFSKNSVCGKAHRLGLSIGNGNNVMSSVRVGRKKPIKQPRLLAMLPDRGKCQWPVDDGWCGCKAEFEKPYCAEHIKLAYKGKVEFGDDELKKLLGID